MRLKDLVDNSKTDKNTLHSYLDIYDNLIGSKRLTAKNILEVGILHGGSIKLWNDYFVNTQIYGIDTMDYNDVWDGIKCIPNIHILTSINAYDSGYVLNTFITPQIKFDLVIDDGPHSLESMMQFITLYSQTLADDGILVIENVQDISWFDQLSSVVPDELKKYIQVYDLRYQRGYDNLLFVINKANTAGIVNIQNVVTILLTTIVHVNSNQAFQTDRDTRINTYLKSIRSWLHNTNFNIVVVENSGYSFPELQSELHTFSGRFEIITYDHYSIINNPEYNSVRQYCNGKGGYEIFQIHYAYDHSKILRNSMFIVKVTGRFYIPQLQSLLSQYDVNNLDGLSQNDQEHCEVIGTHIKNFDKIFDRNLINGNGHFDPHIENVFIHRFRSFHNILRSPVFNIEPTKRGGLNEIYYIL